MYSGKKVGKIIAWVIVGISAVILFGFITMWLWNWLVPDLFNGPVINIWQTFGLLILSKILFSGLGGKHHKGGHGGHWKPYWKERLSHMSPEDKERFRQKMKDKWCGWSGEDTPSKDSGTSNV
ncbi:MAG: hypothetical protein ACOYW3_01695 [Bacteroidota bacterium]